MIPPRRSAANSNKLRRVSLSPAKQEEDKHKEIDHVWKHVLEPKGWTYFHRGKRGWYFIPASVATTK